MCQRQRYYAAPSRKGCLGASHAPSEHYKYDKWCELPDYASLIARGGHQCEAKLDSVSIFAFYFAQCRLTTVVWLAGWGLPGD